MTPRRGGAKRPAELRPGWEASDGQAGAPLPSPAIRRRCQLLVFACLDPLKTSDELEDLLIEEVRRLGSATMSHWASQAEERVSRELKGQDPTVRSRKKKR